MPSSIGGTPSASAISRAAAFLASMKSMSLGDSDSGFQSSPPSSSSGRPALRAPWKAASSSPRSRLNCSPVRLPLAGRIDQRPRGPRRVVEQRLVPGAGRVVDVDGGGGRLDGAHAVVIVGRVEQARVQDRAHAGHRLLGKAHGRPVGRILEGLRPAVRPRDHLHAIGAQHVQFAQAPARPPPPRRRRCRRRAGSRTRPRGSRPSSGRAMGARRDRAARAPRSRRAPS